MSYKWGKQGECLTSCSFNVYVDVNSVPQQREHLEIKLLNLCSVVKGIDNNYYYYYCYLVIISIHNTVVSMQLSIV